VILDLRLAGVESERSWLEAVHSLVERKLGCPVLAVIDGNPGLAAALKAQWPGVAIQRCTNHSVPGRAHSKEVRSPLTGKTLEPVSLGQVVAA
jgi:transposase-like protein